MDAGHRRTFREYPETALLGGMILPAYRSNVAHAIALNDYAIRRLFLGGTLQFSGGNSAINRKALHRAYFDEDFKFAEDLELAARVTGPGAKRYVREMAIYQHSRETFHQYAKQMYQYGFMKVWLSFALRSFRWLDFVPMALLAVGAVAALSLANMVATAAESTVRASRSHFRCLLSALSAADRCADVSGVAC